LHGHEPDLVAESAAVAATVGAAKDHRLIQTEILVVVAGAGKWGVVVW
jgi:hypothetical protein